MSNIVVQKIRGANPSRRFLPETDELLDCVRKRAFELFEKRGRTSGSEVSDWLQAEKEVFRVPDMELTEHDGEFQLQLALPGFDAKDVRVSALPDAVIVEGETTHQHRGTSGTVHYCDFGERRIFRQVPLPKPVDIDHIWATLDNGLLRIRATKAEQGERTKVAA
jgi:HSP20 family protein